MNEKCPRILIVDDETKNIQVLGTLLHQKGYYINVAQNGKQALETVRETLPDIILLDIMMPDTDGFEVCRQLKSSPETKDIPVIFLTVKSGTDDIVRGFELGAADYVTKPFNSAELLARVHTHLELKFSRDRIRIANNERKELVHVLCHDLYNPFTTVNCIFEIMQKYPPTSDKEKEDYISRGLSAMKNCIKLVELIRQMQSLETYEIKPEPVSLADAITESSLLLENKLAEKQIELEVSVDKELKVCAEKTSFVNSVLGNLFSNAVKFSYPGSKVVVRTKEINNHVELTIRDFGIGIPENMLKHFFEIRSITTRTGTAGEKGTGFGMALVRKFIIAYKGTIDISSETEINAMHKQGTQVKLTLKKA